MGQIQLFEERWGVANRSDFVLGKIQNSKVLEVTHMKINFLYILLDKVERFEKVVQVNRIANVGNQA